MNEIDRPFRPRLSFFIIWALLAIPVIYYAIKLMSDLPWYSFVSFAIVVSLFMTFAIYGPILLIQQIISSGSRGAYIARVFASILIALSIIFGIVYLTGIYEKVSGTPGWLCFILLVSVVSNLYLHSRLGR